MKHFLKATGVAVVLIAVIGCGAGRPVVSGLVTLDGKPPDNGTMQFFPVAGDAPTSAAVIGKDGRYRTEVSATKYKVVIHVNKVIGRRKMYEDQADSPMVDIEEEVLPARYSDMNKSELIFDVAPGENTKDFELKSDRKK